MDIAPDPFAHHPELRGKIADPLGSFFRTFRIAEMEAALREQGLPVGWWYSDGEREALRAEALDGRRDSDLWVFAYGSLMWDPALRFDEVRRCHVPDYRRRFILKDIYGGRGTPEEPGLMAALDAGGGCDGLLFRIARDKIEAETEILWRREQVCPCYTATYIEAVAGNEPITALAFVADHGTEVIDASLTRGEQVHMLATGRGFLGTSLDYLASIARQFAALDIEDEDIAALLREAEVYAGLRAGS